MIVNHLSFQIARRKAFLIASLLVVIPAFALSTLALIADRYAYAAETMLDDTLTEERDVLDLSEESLPAYLKAIENLEMARALTPLNADHARALTDVYSSIKVWQEAMKTMGAEGLDGMPSGKDLHDAVFYNAKKAVMLDPSNADHLLLLGRMYAADGMREAALKQWIKAIESYPVNGAIRYAAALQMLMLGLHEQAREQARFLAGTDDSYRLDDDDPSANLIRERRPPGYEARLAGSYLYKAMEITWRTSGKDLKTTLEIVPDNFDAREAVRIFSENKGIDATIK
jgi:tetratricopeptide (TPR) repeat protein